MLTQKPPIRIICPGRTYRMRFSDARPTRRMFHQVEGLVIDRRARISATSNGSCTSSCKAFFEMPITSICGSARRFFPFTEPSLEVDIQCRRDKGEIRFGEGEDWMEILGCGMVHPERAARLRHRSRTSIRALPGAWASIASRC